MEQLRDHRAKCTAGHDDRPLRAERAARPNGNRRGDGLEDRDFWLHTAAVGQDSLDRLGNAVAGDPFRAITRHCTDNQGAANRYKNAVDAEMVPCRRDESGVPTAKIAKISEKADQAEESEGD